MISRATLRQLVVFGLVGVTATCTHYVVALGGHEALGTNLYIANFAGYACAIGVSYLGHGLFTFQVGLSPRTFWRFIIASASAFLASEGILAVLVDMLHIHHRVSLGVVVLTIPIFSFLLNKFWVYRQSPAT